MSEDAAKWYVVHTYSGYENKVMTNLEKIVENRKLHDVILDVKIPTETVVEVKENNEEKETERKLFPGYVMVKMVMSDDTWHVVCSIRGCTGFVGPSGKPVPLTDKEVEAFGVEVRTMNVKFKEGDTVKVIAGPLAGHTGTVEEVNPNTKKIRVMVSMFGRPMPVEVDLSQVEEAE